VAVFATFITETLVLASWAEHFAASQLGVSRH